MRSLWRRAKVEVAAVHSVSEADPSDRTSADLEVATRARTLTGATTNRSSTTASVGGVSSAHVVLDLEPPDISTLGVFRQPRVESDYRAEYLRHALGRQLARFGLLVLGGYMVPTLVGVARTRALDGRTPLFLAGSLFGACVHAYARLAQLRDVPLVVSECFATGAIVLLIVVAQLPDQLQLGALDVDVGSRLVGSGCTLSVVTINYCFWNVFIAFYLPLRQELYLVFGGVSIGTVLLNMRASGALAPGSGGANCAGRELAYLVVFLVMVVFARARTQAVQRSEWWFHRNVQQAAAEQRAQHDRAMQQELRLRTVEAAKNARSRLIRVAMHDLRSPLLAVANLSEALERLPPATRRDDVRMARPIDTMRQLSGIMEHIVSDMLDFERIDSGRLLMTRERLVPARMLDIARATFEGLAAEKQVALEVDPVPVDAQRLRCFGDPSRLQQCVNNGISNALKFTDRGGLVRISLRRAQPPSGEPDPPGWCTLVLRVKDNGVGLSAAELQTLSSSDPFTQVGRGQLQGAGGTGLGLGITREIMRLHHNSQLVLRSEGEGCGTSFELWLALELDTQQQQQQQGSHAHSEGTVASTEDTLLGAAHGVSAAPAATPSPPPEPRALAMACTSDRVESPTLAPRPLRGVHTAPSKRRHAPSGGERVTSANAPAAPFRASATHMLTPPPPETTSRWPLGFRCLHVEDDASLRFSLPLSTFELLGVPYEQAEDGQQALAAVEEAGGDAPFAIVLMDNQMPRLSGTEATRELRARGYTGLIIGMTGDPAGCAERNEFEAAGLSACVDKDAHGVEYIRSVISSFAIGAEVA